MKVSCTDTVIRSKNTTGSKDILAFVNSAFQNVKSLQEKFNLFPLEKNWTMNYPADEMFAAICAQFEYRKNPCVAWCSAIHDFDDGKVEIHFGSLDDNYQPYNIQRIFHGSFVL